MKKLMIIAAAMIGINTLVSAQTVDNVLFGSVPGTVSVSGKAYSSNVAFELLGHIYDGNERERIEYAATAPANGGEYSHDIRMYSPEGLYLLKVNDGTTKEASRHYIYMSDKLSADSVSADIGDVADIGGRIGLKAYVKNYTPEDMNVYYSVGYYSANGTLLNADVKKTVIAPGYDKIERTVSVQPIPDAREIRIMFFDDLMHPLGKTVSAGIAENSPIYVSSGAEGGNGSRGNPFGSISEALSAADEGENNVIFLREGVYNECISLNNRTDITIAALPGEKAVITNAKKLDPSAFSKVSSSDPVYQKLPSSARGKVYAGELSGTGAENAGVIPRIFYGDAEYAYDVVSVNGKRAVLARYPNEGYTQIYNGSAGADSMTFNYIYSEGTKWLDADDMWIKGFFTNGWSVYSMPASVSRTAQIDPRTSNAFKITTDGSIGSNASILGGVPSGRFYVMNLPEEMDKEGEYYIDRQSGKLYIFCGDLAADTDISVAADAENIFTFNKCDRINIMNLSFENIKGQPISGNGNNITVSGCGFYNISSPCITLDGTGIRIGSNRIENVGSAGIRVGGGTVASLSPSDNFIENNEISDYAKDHLVYNPAIGVSGVGARIAHNKISDAPHTAIQFSGNEHIIEYNDISDVVLETGDAGAVYCGRNLLGNGNIIRYNSFKNLRRVSFTDELGTTISTSGVISVVGVYLDDLFSGASVYGNVMDNVDIGVMMGGGSNNIIKDNIIMNKNSDGAPIAADNRGSDGKHNVSYIVSRMDAISYTTGVWLAKYPENLYLRIEDNQQSAQAPILAYPVNNNISGNIFYRHNPISLADDVVSGGTVQNNNSVSSAPDIGGEVSKAGLYD